MVRTINSPPTAARVISAAAVLAGVLLLNPLVARAQPLELRFTATVTGEIEGDAEALELPFSLDPGQLIHGSLRFDSRDELLQILNPDILAYQPSRAQLSLETDGFRFGAAINSGAINQQLAYLNRPQPPPSSSLSLGYGNYWTNVFPGWGGGLVGTLHYPFDSGLRLEGPVGTISSPDDVLNIEIWNELSLNRTLGLTFGYFENNDFKVVQYSASIGEIVAVPEPRDYVLLIGTAIAFGYGHARLARQVRNRGG